MESQNSGGARRGSAERWWDVVGVADHGSKEEKMVPDLVPRTEQALNKTLSVWKESWSGAFSMN